MNNYANIDKYYKELMEDIYPQPTDPTHTEFAKNLIDTLAVIIKFKTVLDVGCGEAFAQPMFTALGAEYTGVCLGSDYKVAKLLGRNVINADFNFLTFPDNSFDLIFSRHSLEHSPFPILTLMEWHRISNQYLCLVVPNPDYYTYLGRNHYSVAYYQQIKWWLRRAGWEIITKYQGNTEYQFICHKKDRKGYEGWAEFPVLTEIYEDDRDD